MARLSKYSNRSTAYSSHPIELKLVRVILGISPLDRFASDCSIFPRGAMGGAPVEIFKSNHGMQFVSD